MSRGNKDTRTNRARERNQAPQGFYKNKIPLKGEIVMKKSLVLAMAMALGISATAFAANPFSDLPAGHWAYASVAKLAAAGVVDGYPDGTFKGDKLMTRYEMAQIVAKALAKGAIGADDKLVSEFADELNNLGVRVAKLEKNADNVKVTGYARLHYRDLSGDFAGHEARLRSRLFFNGEVNDNWHYQAMLQNEQKFAKDGVYDNESGDSATSFQRAFLYGNIGAVKVTAGRYNTVIAEGNVYDHRVDAIKAEVGKQVKFTAEYGKMANKDSNTFGTTATDVSVADKFYRFTVAGNVGQVGLEANYVNAKNQVFGTYKGTSYVDDNNIWTIGANYKVKDFSIGAMYLKGSSDALDALDMSQTGYVVSLGYAGAKAAKANTWGLYGKYYNQGASTVIAHTMNGDYDKFAYEGFKGWMVGANYTVAKNMVAGVEYYDLKGKESDAKAKTLWSQLVITF